MFKAASTKRTCDPQRVAGDSGAPFHTLRRRMCALSTFLGFPHRRGAMFIRGSLVSADSASREYKSRIFAILSRDRPFSHMRRFPHSGASRVAMRAIAYFSSAPAPQLTTWAARQTRLPRAVARCRRLWTQRQHFLADLSNGWASGGSLRAQAQDFAIFVDTDKSRGRSRNCCSGFAQISNALQSARR